MVFMLFISFLPYFPLLKRGGSVMFCGYLCFLLSFPVCVFLYQYIVHEHVLKYESAVFLLHANETVKL